MDEKCEGVTWQDDERVRGTNISSSCKMMPKRAIKQNFYYYSSHRGICCQVQHLLHPRKCKTSLGEVKVEDINSEVVDMKTVNRLGNSPREKGRRAPHYQNT
jgi:hypothetical protein